MKIIIAASFWLRKSSLLRTNQTENKYGTTRANISMVINEGVKIRCKAVTNQVFTLVGLLVELATAITKLEVLLRRFLPLGNLPLQ